MKAFNLDIDELIDILLDLKKSADKVDMEVDPQKKTLIITPVFRTEVKSKKKRNKKLDPGRNLDDLAL